MEQPHVVTLGLWVAEPELTDFAGLLAGNVVDRTAGRVHVEIGTLRSELGAWLGHTLATQNDLDRIATVGRGPILLLHTEQVKTRELAVRVDPQRPFDAATAVIDWAKQLRPDVVPPSTEGLFSIRHPGGDFEQTATAVERRGIVLTAGEHGLALEGSVSLTRAVPPFDTVSAQVRSRIGPVTILELDGPAHDSYRHQAPPSIGADVRIRAVTSAGEARWTHGTLVHDGVVQVASTEHEILRGSPVLGPDGGGVFGFVAQPTRAGATEVAYSAVDFQDLALRRWVLGDEYAPPPVPPRWVRVGGTVRPDDAELALAREIGRMLGRQGFGLVHGAARGVDEAVRAGVLEVLGHSASLRVALEPGWPLDLKQGPGEEVYGADGPVDADTFFGDVLIVLRGGSGLLGLIARASSAGIPVLPLVRGDARDRAVLEAALAASAPFAEQGLTPDALTSLGLAPPEVATERLYELLRVWYGSLDRFERSESATVVPDHAQTGTEPSRDLLDFRGDVERMAQVIADPDLHPPLAIGLFGAWGSGKSFFLEQLHARVHDLWYSQPNRGELGEVEFNAWHFADVQLWAPLASSIFEELARVLKVKGHQDPAARRAELQKELTSAKVVQETAKRQKDDAQRALDAVQKELTDAIRTRNEATASLSALTRRDFRAYVVKRLFETEEGKKLGTDLEEQLRTLGRTERGANLWDESGKLAEELLSFSGFLRSFFALGSGSTLWWVGGILLVCGIPLLAAGVAAVWETAAWKSLSVGAAAEVFAVGTGLLTWARQYLAQARAAAEGLAKLRERGKELVTEFRTDGTEKERAKFAEDLAGAEAKIKVAELRLSDATAAVSRAASALDDLESGRALAAFVAERLAADNPYRRAEGVVSTLRRDLHELTAHFSSVQSGARVGRIVLYIDDLDRCPPDQVVEVLQAIQLLLASDLFVVVVAVDPRWLERSLNARYEGLLANAPVPQPSEISAQEYLEKIFQIPFTMPPLVREGFDSLVRAYLPSERTPARATEEVPPAPSGPAPLVPQEATGPSELQVSTPVHLSPRNAERVRKQLVVAPREQRRMSALSDFFQTPREVKRFVNVYRLLRASVPAAEWDTFVDREYAVVQTLLAASIGFPRSGARLLRFLTDRTSAQGERWTDLLAGLAAREPDNAELARMCARLAAVTGLPHDLAIYARHAPRIGRYSFFWAWGDGLGWMEPQPRPGLPGVAEA